MFPQVNVVKTSLRLIGLLLYEVNKTLFLDFIYLLSYIIEILQLFEDLTCPYCFPNQSAKKRYHQATRMVEKGEDVLAGHRSLCTACAMITLYIENGNVNMHAENACFYFTAKTAPNYYCPPPEHPWTMMLDCPRCKDKESSTPSACIDHIISQKVQDQCSFNTQQ